MSGGKDSTATAIYMLKRYKKSKLRFVFADTGWEHKDTYKYLEYLEKKLKIRIFRIKSEKYKNMENLCIEKKIFPNRIRKFCTIELKIVPLLNIFNRYKEKGFNVISVVGVRKEESKNREKENLWKTNFTKTPNFSQWKKLKNISKSKAVKSFYSKENSIVIYQPIVYWNTQEVYQYHYDNNVELNPLYKKGCSRVGCFPCVNANKFEIGILDNEAISRVRELEKAVGEISNSKSPTFFYRKGESMKIDKIYEQYKFNSLELELNCINPYVVCE